MKLNTYFQMQEFLPPEEYKLVQFSEKPLEAFYKLVDKRIIDLAVFVREFFGKPVRVNTWYLGGQFKERGFRNKRSTTGAKFSMHKQGKAFDFNVVGMSDNEVKKVILENQDKFYKAGLRRMESKEYATTWTHLDIKNVPNFKGKIYVFKP